MPLPLTYGRKHLAPMKILQIKWQGFVGTYIGYSCLLHKHWVALFSISATVVKNNDIFISQTAKYVRDDGNSIKTIMAPSAQPFANSNQRQVQNPQYAFLQELHSLFMDYLRA